MSNEIELAWAAGFFDGEGSTYFHLRQQQKNRTRQYGYVTINVAQIHPGVLERFRAAVGEGKVYGPYPGRGPNESPSWRFIAHGQYADRILDRIAPYLSPVKLEQANIAREAARALSDRVPLKTGRKPKRLQVSLF